MDFQTSLFAVDEELPAGASSPVGALVRTLRDADRLTLTDGAWVDVRRSWLPRPDEVFTTLVERVPWRRDRRQMYDRVVDVPRLLHTYLADDELPHSVLTDAREALTEHYLPELGEPFQTAGCCYYRDGRDSVAWHGDTFARAASSQDTMVAIVSVGDPRKLCLRPRAGGRSVQIEMGHGDLVVMGGSCQRTWEHAVPKVASAGPRISVQFRPAGVF